MKLKLVDPARMTAMVAEARQAAAAPQAAAAAPAVQAPAGAAYVVAMALARTYLGVHWVTDTIGGAILGAAVAVVLWAPIADKLAAEPRARKVRSE